MKNSRDIIKILVIETVVTFTSHDLAVTVDCTQFRFKSLRWVKSLKRPKTKYNIFNWWYILDRAGGFDKMLYIKWPTQHFYIKSIILELYNET